MQDQVILTTAEHLLATTGDTFTMDKLAERAGVSRATVYRRVGSKQKLLQRLAAERGLGEGARPNVGRRILTAAHTLFGRHGLVTPTMEQIAQEAGVGVATVYRHFGDRESLVRAFVRELTPRREMLEATLRQSDDLEADLLPLVASMLRFLTENQEMIRLSFMGSAATIDYLSRLRKAPERTLHRVSGYFEAQIAAGRLPSHLQPQELALALVGMVFSFGFIAPTYYDRQPGEPEQVTRFIARLFLDGIRQM